jgi:hypothetical protein
MPPEVQCKSVDRAAAGVLPTFFNTVDFAGTKDFLFGMWLEDPRICERKFYVEVNCKGVPGSDPELLSKCGVSPRLAFLSLPAMPTVDQSDARIASTPALAGRSSRNPQNADAMHARLTSRPKKVR